MSERVNRLALAVLRNEVYPALPQHVRELFPRIKDGAEMVPNIVVGNIVEMGANPPFPLITLQTQGPAEGMVRPYRHLSMFLDFWVSGGQAANVDGRAVLGILYEYTFQRLHNTNWSGDGVLIKRCYEYDKSAVLFEPDQKLYHLSVSFRVEAISQSWY